MRLIFDTFWVQEDTIARHARRLFLGALSIDHFAVYIRHDLTINSCAHRYCGIWVDTDTAHTDMAHTDMAYTDTAHTDMTYTDMTYIDMLYTDMAYTDMAHIDVPAFGSTLDGS